MAWFHGDCRGERRRLCVEVSTQGMYGEAYGLKSQKEKTNRLSSWGKMKNILLSAFVLMLVTTVLCHAAEKPRQWQLGLLRGMGSESWTSTSTAPVTCTTGVGCSGGQTSSWGHETLTFQISDGEQTYVAGRTLSWRWQHDPKVTENGLMKFAVEKDQLIFLGDDGREFKTHITKKRINTVADQIQECSLITEVLSQRLSGFKNSDLILVLGRYASCGSVGVNAANVPLVQGVERSVSSLLSEEQARITKKDAVSDLSVTDSVAPDSCTHLGSQCSDKKTLASMPDKNLFVLFRQAQGCIAAQLSGSTGLPEPATSRAQLDLAVEGVSRLTGIRTPNN